MAVVLRAGRRQDVDANFRPIKRHAHNDYLQDRASMVNGSFTASPVFQTRTSRCGNRWGNRRSNPGASRGASDIAIVQFRRLMIDAARTSRKGRVIGYIAPRLAQARLRSYQGVVEKSVPGERLGVGRGGEVLTGLEEDETDKEMAARPRSARPIKY